jgi:3-dehydroquinate dehydratase-2
MIARHREIAPLICPSGKSVHGFRRARPLEPFARPLKLEASQAGAAAARENDMRIMIINGPNLNLLGVREPHIYGTTTLEAIRGSCEEFAAFAGAQLSFHQSNHEGELVDLIQAARREADAVIINPAAYSFTSIAMYDAMKIFEGPIFEVHISNIHARDELHRHSKLSAAVKAVIAGLGPYGYIVAMQAALQGAGKLPASLPPAMRVGPR